MKHRFGFSSFSRSFSQHQNRKRQTKKKNERIEWDSLQRLDFHGYRRSGEPSRPWSLSLLSVLERLRITHTLHCFSNFLLSVAVIFQRKWQCVEKWSGGTRIYIGGSYVAITRGVLNINRWSWEGRGMT